MGFYDMQGQICKVREGNCKALILIYIAFIESTSIIIEGLWFIDGFLQHIYKVREGSYKALTLIYIGFIESTYINIGGL